MTRPAHHFAATPQDKKRKTPSPEDNENNEDRLTDTAVAPGLDSQNSEFTTAFQMAQARPVKSEVVAQTQTTKTNATGPQAASKASESNGLMSLLSKPMTEHSSSKAASWFGSVPTGAVLSGAAMTLMALQPKDKTGSTTAADTQAPSLSSAVINNSTGNQLVLLYNESLSNVLPSTSTFQVLVDGVSTSVSSVARGSDLRSLILTLDTPVTSARQVTVSLSDGNAVKDLAGNTANNFRDQAVTVTDLVAPTLLSSQAITNNNQSVIVLRFSETLKSTTLLDPANFSISVAGVTQTITAQQVLGDSIRLTLASKITGTNPNINLQYTPPTNTTKAVQDTAGNLAAVIGPVGGIVLSHSVDTTAPTLNTSAATERQVRVIQLTFNEALDASALPIPSSFTVNVANGGSTSSMAVSSLKLMGSVLELTLVTTVTDSQAGLRVSYTQPSTGDVLKDWAGNPVAAFDRSVSTVDAVAPNLLSSRFTSDRTLELTFNEDLAPLSALEGNWSLTANGGSQLKPSSITVSGKTLSLSFASSVQSGQAISLAYTAPALDATPLNRALQDTLGNDSPSFSRTLDSAGPTLSSAVTSSNGLQVWLNYNEALLAPNSSGTPVVPAVAASAFVVLRGDGSRINVSSVTISGAQVQLSLASVIQPADTISVIYNAPALNVGVGNAAVQDSSGNDAASLGSGVTGQAVINDAAFAGSTAQLKSSTSALNQVVMQFNEVITGNLPTIEAFTVKAGGVTQTITGIARDTQDGSKLVLTLSGSVDDAGPLLLSYTPPGSAPLRGASGKTLGSISNQSLGELIVTVAGDDTKSGAANRVDYFLGSTGNDTLSGLGGADHFVWPDFGEAGPSGFTQTLTDFGFKKGSGSLQGLAEGDVLDLSQLLNGYTQANEATFLRAIKTADNKLLLQIDHDGGTTFTPTANVLFNNVTVTSTDQLQVNNLSIAHSVNGSTNNLMLSNFVEHLRLEGQLTVL
jgi:uncharacterized repeat protein (TIGR02059 family)